MTLPNQNHMLDANLIYFKLMGIEGTIVSNAEAWDTLRTQLITLQRFGMTPPLYLDMMQRIEDMLELFAGDHFPDQDDPVYRELKVAAIHKLKQINIKKKQ